MNLGKLILNYLLALAKHWIPAVFLIGDVIWFSTVVIGDIQIPPLTYFVVFGLEFLIANFILYRKNQLEILQLKVEAQKEIESLKSKILDLEDRIPKLSLFFKVGDELVQKQTVVVREKPVKPDIDKLVKNEQDRLIADYESYVPSEDEFSSDPVKRINEMAKLMMNIPKKHEDYEKECREYLKYFKAYLVSKYNYDLGQARYRAVRFAVENTGRTPGHEIVLLIHFPDALYVYSMDDDDSEKMISLDFLSPPEKPEPPKVTKSITDLANRFSFTGSLVSSPPINTDFGLRKVRGPFITRHKSTEIEYEIKELIHNFIEDNLDELYFIVLDEAIGGLWEIKYGIHAANLPTPIPGSLWIEVVEK